MLAIVLVPATLKDSARCPLLWQTRGKALLQRHSDAAREWGIELVALTTAAAAVEAATRSQYFGLPCEIRTVPSEGTVEALWTVRDRLRDPKDGTIILEATVAYSLKLLRRLQCTGPSTMFVDDNEGSIGTLRLSNADSRRLAPILEHKIEVGRGAGPYTDVLKMLERTTPITRVISELRFARFGSEAQLAASDDEVRRIDAEDSCWDVLRDGPR